MRGLGRPTSLGWSFFGSRLTLVPRPVELAAAMNYEAFRAAWESAHKESGLPTTGIPPIETLNTHNLDREYKVHLEPLGGGLDAEPFQVSATLAWRWTALTTSRSTTGDDDVLGRMLPQHAELAEETSKPVMPVFIDLKASTPFSERVVMPTKADWARWVRETKGRLQGSEPLVLEGSTEVQGWMGDLKAKFACYEDGDMLLEAVELSALQVIKLPRFFDEFAGQPDEGPEEQLRGLFHRVRASLSAWMQALDYLRPKTRG